MEPLFGQVAGVGLGDRSGLDRGQHRGELLDPGHHLDQLVVGPGRPQDLGQAPHRRDRLGQHRGGCRAGDLGGDRHTTMESGGTDIPGDIHRGYPSVPRSSTEKSYPRLDLGEREKNRHHKEHLQQRRTRKQTSGGTATQSKPPPHFSSFTTATTRQTAARSRPCPRVSRRSPERPPQPAEPGATSSTSEAAGATSSTSGSTGATSSTSGSTGRPPQPADPATSCRRFRDGRQSDLLNQPKHQSDLLNQRSRRDVPGPQVSRRSPERPPQPAEEPERPPRPAVPPERPPQPAVPPERLPQPAGVGQPAGSCASARTARVIARRWAQRWGMVAQ